MAIFKSLTFDGVNSLDYGIYITGEAVYNAPERAVEMINIPGKNGALALDQGRFENIEVTYHAGCFADSQADFADKVMRFRNALASRYTYKRLTDEYHPDEYRLGLYKSGLDVDAVRYGTAGEFNIVFDCKPQRFLTDGDRAILPTEWSDVQTASGEMVTIDSDGSLAVKSLEVSLEPIQSLNGYDKPWAGGAGKNLLPINCESTVKSGVTYTVYKNASGAVTRIHAEGTSTAAHSFSVVAGHSTGNPFKIKAGSYWFKGLSDGLGGSYDFNIRKLGESTDIIQIKNKVPIVLAEDTDFQACYLYVYNGKTLNLDIYPMVWSQSESNDDFEPYSNICPISGTSEVDVYVSNDNLITARENWFTNASGVIEYYTNYHAVVFPVQQGKTYSVLIEQAVTPNRIYAFYEDYPQVGSVSYNRSRVTSAPTTMTAPIDGWCVYRDVPQNTFVSVVLGSTPRSAEEAIVYTSELGRTAYGGTLDVTSGVLTVTHGCTKFTASDNWQYRNPSGFYIADDSFALAPDTTGFYYKSDMYGQTNWATKADKCISAYSTSSRSFIIFDSRFTSVTDFKAAMPQEGIQVWYLLAEPQTYQLTPQQIDLLLGTNHLWSDGEITVEYGVHPYYNPTPFNAKPLIKVTGTGTLGIGEYILTITGTASQTLYIDCETMEIYTLEGTVPTGASSLVSINRNDFPVLEPGTNYISVGSGITAVTITPRWWRI